MKIRTWIKDALNPTLALMNARIDSAKNGEVAGDFLDHDLPLLISRPNPTCIDVGANVGQTIRLFERVFNQPTIHALEPATETFNILSENIQVHDRLHLYNLAAGKEIGEITFNSLENSELSSVLEPKQFPWMAEGEKYQSISETVSVITIDQLILESGIEFVDILKSDTQGYDLNVLRGAERSLRAGKIGFVLVELNFCEMYVGQNTAHELIAYLDELGYFIIDFYERVRKPRHRSTLSWCTALFGRRDL